MDSNMQAMQSQNVSQNQAASGESSTSAAPTMDQLMARSPLLAPLGNWLKCLRKPALSLEYSFQKRHVPDLDTDTGKQEDSSSKPGHNSDVMGLNGGFTIRYFDFAMGILGLTILSCVTRGGTCIRRWMR